MNTRYLIGFLTVLIAACTGKEPSAGLPDEGLIDIRGSEMFFKMMGKGEPMVIVHGGPGLDHSYLLPQMGFLQDHFQLIFFDQRASGKSASDVDSTYISLDGFVEDIEGIRKTLDLGKIHLMGHSWGGLLAMKYAIKYGKNLKTLILLNSVGASSESGILENQIIANRMTAEDSLGLQQIFSSDDFQNRRSEAFESMMYINFRNQFYDRSLAGELTLDFQDNYFENSQKLQHLAKDLQAWNLHQELESVNTPALIIYGDYDPLSIESGPRIATALRNDRFEVIPECGHFPYIEKPEVLRNLLVEFTKER